MCGILKDTDFLIILALLLKLLLKPRPGIILYHCFYPWKNVLKINFFFIVFFHYHLSPYTLSSTLTTLLSMSMRWVLSHFCSNLLISNPPPIAINLISIYKSVSILLLSSVGSLDSTWVKSYVICLSLTGLFHSAQCSLCWSMLSQKVKFSSFLRPSSILLCK